MANAFLGGMQAARQDTLATLKMEDAVSTLKARRQQGAKAERLQNYLGMYQKAAPGERAGLESQIAGEFPERAQKMREFRTSGEADLAEKLGGYAAVASRAIGTEEEPQAMLWLAQQATEAGVPPDQVKQAFQQYQANPESARLIIDGMMVEGMGGAEYLKQYETPADVAKGKRATRLEKLKQTNRLALEKVKQKGKAPGVREEKITAAMTDYGITRKQAQDIVDGRIKVKTDPLSGQNRLVNVATGTSTLVTGGPKPIAPAGVDVPSTKPEKTVFDMLEKGVGAGAVMREGLAVTGGQVFEDLNFPETTTARTKIKGLREKLIRALSLSGKPPVVEQSRLLEMLPSTGIFESDEHARTQLIELHGQLSRQVLEDASFAKDESNPKKLREQAAERARGITSMLRELGAPSPEGGQSISTQAEYDALPSGATYTDAETGKKGRKP